MYVMRPLSRQSSGFCSKRDASLLHWSALIRNHVSRGSPMEAFRLYTQIRNNGVYIFGIVPLVLKACASLCFASFGKALHAESVKCGTHFDVLVGTSLVDMYGKCRETRDARKVFDSMPERNVVTWNAMIGGYWKNNDVDSASELFERMSVRTSVTWIEMIGGFSRIGDTGNARRLFDLVPSGLKTLVTWTVMVDGYCSNGEMDMARRVFERMPGRNFFAWSSMVSGYCKKGNVEEARAIFDRIPVKNLVNWNSMISGYIQNGFSEDAMEVFHEMRVQGYEPDEVTAASVLSACGHLGRLDLGREIHSLIIDKRVRCNDIVLNSLLDMYAKCGDLSNARLVFQGMNERNRACWNSMITGLAVHGRCEEALELFGRMEGSSQRPDGITFLAVLSACAHGGYVDEGMKVFAKMERNGVEASVKHYGCVVDLLARAGRLKDAYGLIKTMPMGPSDTVWGAMLGACRTHLDVEMAERVVKDYETMRLNAGSAQNKHRVIMSSIYAASDRWEEAGSLRLAMVNRGFEKPPGFSSFIACE